MREQSDTRKRLERALRELLPELPDTDGRDDATTATATAGVGGLVAGYFWGFLRGRKSARRKS